MSTCCRAAQPPPRNPHSLCRVYFGLFGFYFGFISVLSWPYFVAVLFLPYFGLISVLFQPYFGLIAGLFRPYFGRVSALMGATDTQNPTICLCRPVALSLSSETTSGKISLIEPYFRFISSSPCSEKISTNTVRLIKADSGLLVIISAFFCYSFFCPYFLARGFGRGGGVLLSVIFCFPCWVFCGTVR